MAHDAVLLTAHGAVLATTARHRGVLAATARDGVLATGRILATSRVLAAHRVLATHRVLAATAATLHLTHSS